MKYEYDENKKVLTLDGESNLILTHEKHGIHLNKCILNTDDFKVEIKNHYLIGIYKGNGKWKKFKSNIELSIKVLKYIWNKY